MVNKTCIFLIFSSADASVELKGQHFLVVVVFVIVVILVVVIIIGMVC